MTQGSKHFGITGEIQNSETFASGSGIRELARLLESMGKVDGENEKGLPPFVLRMAPSASQNYIGMKQLASVNVNTKPSGTWINDHDSST